MSSSNVPTIHVLPSEVANQIAAGEVVERPASVVKELVENALDAGATEIRVEALGGGTQLLRVEDNGHGMRPEDAELAVKSHATSKLQTATDLSQLSTFGFRGEALPSIASVSRFSLSTAVANAAQGVKVRVEGGSPARVEPAPPVQGTVIEVQELFYNTPARRKFLKRPATEMGHISDVLIRLALAYPSCAFQFKAEGRSVLNVVRQSPSGEDPKPRLAQLLGKTMADGLVALEDDGLKRSVEVKGFLGAPPLSERGNRGQYTFVNGRFVRDKTIQRAISEAYSGRIPRGRQPVVVLFIELDPADVDINVHPQKIEVRFVRSGEVYRAVHGHLRRGLLSLPLAPQDPEADVHARRRVMGLKTEQNPVELTFSKDTSTPDRVEDRPLQTHGSWGASPSSSEGRADDHGDQKQPVSPTYESLVPTLGGPKTGYSDPTNSTSPAPSPGSNHGERLLKAFSNRFHDRHRPSKAEKTAAMALQRPALGAEQRSSEVATVDMNGRDAYAPTESHPADTPVTETHSTDALPLPAEAPVAEAHPAAPADTPVAKAHHPAAPADTPVAEAHSTDALPLLAEDLRSAKRIGMLWSRYLLLEASDALWLVDLKGVSLRVALESTPPPSWTAQALLLPLPLQISSAAEQAHVEEHLHDLSLIGLEVRTQADDIFLHSAPSEASGLDLRAVFYEALEAIVRGENVSEYMGRWIIQAQVTRGTPPKVPTTPQEIEALLAQWENCEIRNCGLDGRALMVAINTRQLSQLFNASVS